MMLRRDRERWGMSVGGAGWRLGIAGGGRVLLLRLGNESIRWLRRAGPLP